MKLKQVSLSILAALLALPTAQAANPRVVLSKDMAVQDPWMDGNIPCIDYIFYLGAVDIHLGQSINFGSWNDAYIKWNQDGKSGYYTLTGSGKLSGYGQGWALGRNATYEIAEGVSLGNHVSMTAGDSDIIINSNCDVWELSWADTLYINAPKFRVTDCISEVDLIVSDYDITTKNLNGLIGGVSKIDGNLVVNGGIWHHFFEDLDVTGNVNFSGKTNIYVYRDYRDKPSAADINETLSYYDGEVLMSCSSYTGKLTSLNLIMGYSLEGEDIYGGHYFYEAGEINVGSYGCFMPVFNSFTNSYDIVYKHYGSAANLDSPSQIIDGVSYYMPGAKDIYLKGTANLSKTGAACVEWDAAGGTVCMFGKGQISSKGDLNMVFLNGTFSIGDGVKMKKPSIYMYEADVTFSSALAVDNIYASESVFSLGAGKLTVADNLELQARSVMNLGAALTADSLYLNNSVINLNADKAQSVTIKGGNSYNRLMDSKMDVTGKMSVASEFIMVDSSLSLHDVADAAKPKAQGLTVKGELIVDGTRDGKGLSTTGVLSTLTLDADDTIISIAAEKGLAAQSVKLTRAQVSKGVVQENSLTNTQMDVNGAMTVAGNLELDNSTLRLRDYSGKKKAVGLSVKGGLNLTGGSTLSMTGALSAKNLTLGSGSSLTLGGSKMSTIKVGGALDLSGAVTLNLGFTVKEADVAKRKAFTLFTFKEFAGSLDNLTLGYEGAYTLDFNAKETGITLVIADAAAWNEYATTVQETALTTQTAVTLKEEEESELPVATAVLTVDPVLAGLADTLVQSTWGVAGASRAFAETISGRGAHATLLEGGKGAAWVSVMGGSSRISSDGGHKGADFTLSGAAIGIEGNVTEKSTIGLAIGNSWGKVSPFSAYRVDQDSTHYGVYGNHALRHNLTLSWMAAHTRTESDGNLAGMDCDWTQDALQLDARLTWSRALNEKTTVSAFGGLQYLATDSADFNGLSTGSVQNLRTEIGAGITHKVAPATQVYGELSFIGDVARNNPTATVGDYRTRGANPGRVGMNLHIGAAHQLNDSWSVNAGYSFELQKNATSHSLNAGASYKF